MFSGPLEGLLRAAGTVSEKQLCSEGSTGTKRVYALNRRRAKKLIPDYDYWKRELGQDDFNYVGSIA